jgi:hypothetical protein
VISTRDNKKFEPSAPSAGGADQTLTEVGPPSGMLETSAPDAAPATPREVTTVASVRRTDCGQLEAPSENHETESVVIRRSRRIDRKITVAREMLATLPRDDRRARLVYAAIVRRDETLLDALLGADPTTL